MTTNDKHKAERPSTMQELMEDHARRLKDFTAQLRAVDGGLRETQINVASMREEMRAIAKSVDAIVQRIDNNGFSKQLIILQESVKACQTRSATRSKILMGLLSLVGGGFLLWLLQQIVVMITPPSAPPPG